MTKLTDSDWRKVFEARCRSKRGIASREDLELCAQAWQADRKRYTDMDERVFVETMPFGSRRSL